MIVFTAQSYQIRQEEQVGLKVELFFIQGMKQFHNENMDVYTSFQKKQTQKTSAPE